jgi:hypothetical protein
VAKERLIDAGMTEQPAASAGMRATKYRARIDMPVYRLSGQRT